MLQERLTQQQVTISSLQATLQSSRNKLSNSSRDAEALARVSAEKETLITELDALKIDFKRLEREKGQMQIKLSSVR